MENKGGCSQLLELVLKRACGAPIKLYIYVKVQDYGRIFEMLRDVLSDITVLKLWPDVSETTFLELSRAFRQPYLPSLATLSILFRGFSGNQAVNEILQCFLDIAARSKLADQLSITIRCWVDSLIPVLRQHQVFYKVRDMILIGS
jgi:hypothetical protein